MDIKKEDLVLYTKTNERLCSSTSEVSKHLQETTKSLAEKKRALKHPTAILTAPPSLICKK